MGSDAQVIQHAIVTYARSWSSLAAVRSLGKRGVRIHSGDSVKFGAASFSKYCESTFVHPNPNNEKEFINFLIKKCQSIRKKYGGNILLLPIHEEAYVIARNREKFPDYVSLVATNSLLLDKIQHKGDLIDIAKEHGVRIPKTWYPKTKDEALTLGNKLEFPVYVKTPESVGSVGIFRVESKHEYSEVVEKNKLPLVVQEYIPGKDYCACALYDQGKPVALVTYGALQTYPARGGTTVYRENVQIKDIDDETKKLLGALNWHGVAELDFRVDERNGKAVLIEVNPRFWGGLNQAISSELDFPYLVWRMAEGHKIDFISKVNNKVRTRNFATALAATVQEMAEVDTFRESLYNYLSDRSWKNFRHFSKALYNFIPNRKQYLVKRYLSQKDVVDDLYDPKDPRAMAGILFPLAVYAKYGKINTKLLISDEKM